MIPLKALLNKNSCHCGGTLLNGTSGTNKHHLINKVYKWTSWKVTTPATAFVHLFVSFLSVHDPQTILPKRSCSLERHKGARRDLATETALLSLHFCPLAIHLNSLNSILIPIINHVDRVVAFHKIHCNTLTLH